MTAFCIAAIATLPRTSFPDNNFASFLFRSFRIIQKCTKIISIPKFLPHGLQAFRSSFLCPIFGQFESTKLSSIRKVFDGKVRNFSPTKISSFTVHQSIYSRSLYATSRGMCMTCDSDVMEKPSRRWRGAVQQLADVVWESQFSCDYPWSRNRESNFFLTDLLTFFLFSSSENCLKMVATDFFYSFPANSGDETKSGYVVKHLFLYASKYLGRLTFELWNSVANFCR